MKCDICGSSRAVIHIQQIAGSEEININICEKCAVEKGLTIDNRDLSVSLKNLLANFDQIKKAIESRDNDRSCSECGRTLEDLKKTGKAGCSGCYREFSRYITAFLKGQNGSFGHRGKSPFRVNIVSRKKVEMDNLSSQLKKAVRDENYEEAAYLRDRIRLMERQLRKYGRK